MPENRFREATAADAELLAQHRAAVWQEVGEHGPEIVDFIPTWAAYMRGAFEDGTYRGFVCTVDDVIAGSAGMHVKAALPRPEHTSTFEARVQSVWVEPAFRRRGIARELMRRLIGDARERNVMRLVLHPSDVGRPLYKQLGFTAADEMTLALF